MEFPLGFQVVTVGYEGEAASFLSWRDPMPFYVNSVGVCTGMYEWYIIQIEM